MGIGIIYFVVIIIANSLGALSGMGGGVLIKPIFDLIGAHSVNAVSFYSTVAVFTMSIVSTLKQLKNGQKLVWSTVIWVSAGAMVGGVVGKQLFSYLLATLHNDGLVNLIQIVVTIITLLYALIYTHYHLGSFRVRGWWWELACGLTLGFFASFLGIGGGPINVALLMMLFGMPIKQATVYSICTIFFSQLSKIGSIAIAGELMSFDLSLLAFIVPAAIIGGFAGATLSHLLSTKMVGIVFQWMIVVVIIINLYNGVQLLV